MTKRILTICSLSMLTACASITSGSNQSLSVTTTPVVGASCQLSNDDGSWFVPVTPGTVTIHRSASDMTVICQKDKLSGTARVVSSTKSLAFGNILAGGIIGAAVDHSSGAAFDYPALITVPMQEGGMQTTISPPPPADQKQSEADFPSSRTR